MNEKNNETNIKYVGCYAVEIRNVTVTNSVKEMMQIADRKKAMVDYVKKKFPNNYDFVNIRARNVFSSKRVTSSMIVCLHGFNHYCLRDVILNNNNK